MKKTILALSIVTLLSGCAVIQSTGLTETDPTVTGQRANIKKEFDTLPAPAAQANIASLSTAVTQGAETFLIKALSDVGQGRWFEVVERVGIDNLTKERLIIRQMREAYEGSNAKPLLPMQFAGIIIEGGIVGYDSSTSSGGAGMRVFGIGRQTQWSADTVTVSLRAVSVNTGKVLSSVTVQKTILSTGDSATALKFYDQGTKAFEAEMGLTINEPGTYAVKAATEMAVVELIKEGQRKGVWDYKSDVKEPPAISFVPTPIVAPVISSEVKKEEVKAEVKKEEVKAEVKKEEVKAEVKAEEVKVEVKKVEEVKKAEVKAEEVKVEVKAELPSNITLSEAQFIYKEMDDTSQKTWQFKKGAQVTIVKEHGDWVEVRDAEKRKGFVKRGVLVNKQP
jgi:curli production assembly/transport component CsgG